MNFFSGRLRPSAIKTISKKDLTELIVNEVRTAAKVHRGRGRPKKSIMGDGNCQVTLHYIQQIANAVIDKLDADGAVLDQSANHLYQMDERRSYVENIRSRLTTRNRESTKQGLFERAEEVLPELVDMGKTRANSPSGRMETWYIHRDSATPLDLHGYADRAMKKGRRENELNDKVAKVANALSEYLADGETYEEGRARYFESIRNGDIPPGKNDW